MKRSTCIQRDIVNQAYHNQVKYTIYGNKGTFDLYREAFGGEDIGKFSVEPYKVTISWSIVYSEDHDLMDILVTEKLKQGSSMYQKLFGDIFEDSKDGLAPSKYSNRAKYLSALAILSVIPDSRLEIYNHSIKFNGNIIEVEHDLANGLIRKHIEPDGSIVERLEQALEILWYHYPTELTNYDSLIRKVTKENELWFS